MTSTSPEHLRLQQTRWLIEHGRRLLDESPASIKGLQAWQDSLLSEQRQLRWRSRHRFPQPENWLWTDKSLAQASDHWCARYKASLFPDHELVVDACCGAGSDLVALAHRGEVQGIDCDPSLVALAHDNAQAHGFDVAVHSQQLPSEWSRPTAWLSIDPDRRVAGRRTTDSDDFAPSLQQIFEMAQSCRGAMIKLAPSTHFSEQVATQVEDSADRVWLGNMGECRQQLLLTGQLRQSQRLRTAVLCEPSQLEAKPTESYRSNLDISTFSRPTSKILEPLGTAGEVLEFVFDLHNVLHASELHLAWAQDNSLQCLGREHGYFTGDQPVGSPWHQMFRVVDVIAWDDRKVRKWLRDYGAGPVEVKSRSVKLDANAYQRRYAKGKGLPITLLITRIDERVRCIAAQRI